MHVQLRPEDMYALQAQTNVATTLQNSYLAVAARTINDTAGNRVNPILPSRPLLPSSFIGDLVPPRLVRFSVLSGADGHNDYAELHIQFTEVVNTSTIDFSRITLQSAAANATYSHTLTGGQLLTNLTHIVKLALTQNDISSIISLAAIGQPGSIGQGLLQSPDQTFLSLDQGALTDMSQYPSVRVPVDEARPVATYEVDYLPPALQAFFFNASSSMIALFFSEPIDKSTFDSSLITLQNCADGRNTSCNATEALTLAANYTDEAVFTSTTTLGAHPANSSISFYLNAQDVDVLQKLTLLATGLGNTFVSLQHGVALDFARNPADEILVSNALSAAEVAVDTMQPEIVAAMLDLSVNTITLTFSEVVVTSSLKPERIVLHNKASDATAEYTLTGGTVLDPTFNRDVIQINLTDADVNAIKFYPELSLNFKMFLSIEHVYFYPEYARPELLPSDFVFDTSGNPCVYISSDAAKRLVPYVKDRVPSIPTEFSVDLDAATLSLTFNEPINFATLNVSAITLLQNDTSAVAVSLTNSSSATGVDESVGTEVIVSLSKGDLDRIKALPLCTKQADGSDCVLALSSTFAEDFRQNAVAARVLTAPASYQADATAPELVNGGFLSLDLNTGVFVLSFSEPVLLSSIDTSVIQFQSSFKQVSTDEGFRAVAVTNASIYQPRDTESALLVALQLSHDNLNNLKQEPLVCRYTSNCYVVFSDSLLVDMADNAIAPVVQAFPGQPLQQLLRDETQPELEAFDLNMDRAQLTLSFSEVVDPASLNASALCLHPTSNSSSSSSSSSSRYSWCLTGGSSAGRQVAADAGVASTVVVVDVSSDDMRALKARRVASSANTTFLSMGAGAIVDTAFEPNGVVGVPRSSALGVRSYTGDSVGPRLARFEVDMEVAEVRLLFNEPVEVGSFDVTQFVLQNVQNSSNGGGVVLEEWRLSNSSSVRGGGNALTGFTSAAEAAASVAAGVEVGESWVVVELGPDDEIGLKSQRGLAASTETTYAWFGAGLVADMGGNAVHAIGAESAQEAVAHAGNEQLTSLVRAELDMQARELVLVFDDVVDPDTLKVEHVQVQSGQGVVGGAGSGVVAYGLLADGGSETRSDVGFSVVISLGAADVLGLALVGGVGRDAGRSYVSLGAAALDDIAGRDIVALPEDRALQVAEYVADTRAPEVVDVSVNMTAETIALRFSEAVNVSTLQADALVVQVAGNMSASGGGGAEYVLSGAAGAAWSRDQESVVVSLLKEDVDAIKVLEPLLTSAGTAFVRHSDGLVEDVFGVGIEAVGAERGLGVSAFGADEVAPEMTAFSIDMDTAILTINFSEPVRPASFLGNQSLTLVDGLFSEHTISSASFVSAPATLLSVVLLISYEDMVAIKTKRPLCLSTAQCQISGTRKLVKDMVGNELQPRTPMAADAVAVDVTPPRLVAFDIDMSEQTLVLTFDEPVLASTLEPSTLTLSMTANSSQADARALFALRDGSAKTAVFDPATWPADTPLPCLGSYLPLSTLNVTLVPSEASNATCTKLWLEPAFTAVRFSLSTRDFNEVAGRTGLATSRNTTWLAAAPASVQDVSPNNNTAAQTATAIGASGYVADTVAPTIASFSVDMSLRQLALTFSEPVWQASLNTTALNLKSRSSLNLGHTHRLTNASVPVLGQPPAGEAHDLGEPRDWTVSLVVVVQLAPGDVEPLLSRSYYLDAHSSLLMTDGAVVVDASGNAALATSPSVLQTANFTRDAVRPQLVSFELNMTSLQLTLTFDEAVMSLTGNSGLITLHEQSGMSNVTTFGQELTLSGNLSYFAGRNSSVQVVEVATPDAHALKLLVHLATAAETTHISMLDAAIADMSGNPSVAVVEAMQAAVFAEDVIPPTLTSFQLNLTSEVLRLSFDEPVNASSALAQRATLASNRTAGPRTSGDGADAVELAPSLVLTPNGLVVEFQLQQADVNCLNWNIGLARGAGTTVLSFVSGFVDDMNGNAIVSVAPESGVEAELVVPDVNAPELLSFRLNLTTEVLFLTFSEVYNVSSVDVTSITLLSERASSPAPGNHVTLSGGTVFETHPYPSSAADPFEYTTLAVQLTFADLNHIKVREPVCVSSSSCFISVTRTLLRDMTGNAVVEVSPSAALNVSEFGADTVRPEMVDFVQFDMNHGRITILFNEIMDVSSIDYTSVALAESFDSTDLFQLTGGTVFPEDVLQVTLNLTVDDLNRLKQFRPGAGQVRICATRTACYLRFNATAITDMNANPAVPVTVGGLDLTHRATSFVADTTPPKLVSYVLDQRSAELLLTFDETVDGSTVVAQQITLQGSEVYNSTEAYTLTGSTLVSDRRDSTVVVLELLPADVRQIKAVTNLAISENNTFLRLGAGAFEDMSGNEVQAMALGMQASTVYTDEASPELVSFQAFDLRDNLIRLSFSEAVEISSVQFELVRIQSVANGLGGTVIPLTGGTARYATTDKTSVELLLNREDIRSFKLDGSIATSKANTFLTLGPGVIQDKFGLESLPVSSFTGKTAVSYVPDTSQAVLEQVTLDMNSAELHLFFDDVVNASTLDPTRIVFQQSAGISAIVPGAMVPEYYTLQGGSTQSPHGFDVVVQLTQHDLNALKRRPALATAKADTFVRLQEGALKSVVELQSVVAITRQVDTYTADSEPPELVAFSLNMTSATLWLQFSEAVNVSTVNPAEIVLQAFATPLPVGYDSAYASHPPQGDGVVQLTGGVVYGGDIETYPTWPSAVEVSIDILKVDLDNIKRDVALASSLDTTYMSHSSSFLKDMSAFSIVPTPVNATDVTLAASAFFPDTISPQLLAFEVSMNETDSVSAPVMLLSMYFSEPVDVVTLDFTQISFFASAGSPVPTYTIRSAFSPSVNDTMVEIYPSSEDVYRLMRIPGLVEGGSTSVLAITSAFVSDMASQPIVARTQSEGFVPVAFVQDTVRPRMYAFDLNMTAQTLDMFFREPVVAAVFNETQITLHFDCQPNAVGAGVVGGNVSLSNATDLLIMQSANGTNLTSNHDLGMPAAASSFLAPTVELNVTSSWTLVARQGLQEIGLRRLRLLLHPMDFNQLAWRFPLGYNASSTCLSLTERMVTDYMDNSVVPVSKQEVQNLTADMQRPQLLQYSLDLDSGNVSLLFDEPLDMRSWNTSRLVLASRSSASDPGFHEEQLTQPVLIDATRIMEDPVVLTLTLTREDMDRVQMATSLAIDAASTFLSFDEDLASDMAGNAIVAVDKVPLTSAAAAVYTPDTTPPRLVSYELHMVQGQDGLFLPITVTVEFNEAINVSSIDTTQLTFSTDHLAATSVSLQTRVPAVRIDARRAKFNLSDTDRLAIKAKPPLLLSANWTVLSCTPTFALDMSGNAMVAVAPAESTAPAVFDIDIVRPRAEAFDLNMTSHTLTVYFSEKVLASSFNLSKVHLQNAPVVPSAQQRLGAVSDSNSGTTWQLLTPGYSRAIEVGLSSKDVNDLELAWALASSNTTTFLRVDEGVAEDTATNLVFPIATSSALLVSEYARDSVRPRLVAYDVNMINATLHLEFSENVDVGTFDVTELVLSNHVSTPSETFSLTGGTTSPDNDTLITVFLSREDSEYLRATTTLASQNSSTALSFRSLLVQDMAANPVVSVALTAAVPPRAFIADALPPVLVFSQLNVTTGVITLAFSEPVDVSSVNITRLRFVPSDSSPLSSAAFRLSATSTAIEIDLVTIAVILSDADLNLLKALPVCTAESDCFINAELGFIADPEGLIIPEALAPVDSFFPDVVRPHLESTGFQSFDLDTGVLVLHFRETINASSLDIGKFALQSSFERGSEQDGYSYIDNLQGSVVSTLPTQLLAVQLNADSLNRLKQNDFVCTVKRDCYLYFEAGAVLDMNNNPIVATGLSFPGFVVQQLLRDETQPELEAFDLNMDRAQLTLSFSEVVDPASLNASALCLHPTSNSSSSSSSSSSRYSWCLTGGSSAGRQVAADAGVASTVVVVDVSSDDMRALKARRVASSANTTFLSMGAGAIVDTAFEPNGVVGVPRSSALGVRSYTGDSVGPRLARFEVDMEVAEVRLLFNEPVEVGSFDVTQFVLQNVQNSSNGGGVVLEEWRLSNSSSVRGGGNALTGFTSAAEAAASVAAGVEVGESWVVVELGPDDEIGLKSQRGLAASTETTYAWFGAGLVADMGGNAVHAIGAESAQEAVAHAGNEQLTSLVRAELDMQARELVLVFDDVVDPDTLKVEHVQVQSGQGVVGGAGSGVVAYGLLADGGSETRSDVGFSVVISLGAADVLGLALVGGVGRDAGRSYVSLGAAALDDIAGRDIVALPEDRALQVAEYVADTRAPEVVDVSVNMTAETIALRFSEAVNVSTLQADALVVQVAGNMSASGGGGAEYVLSGAAGAAWSRDQESVVVSLLKEDVDAIKVLEPLLTSAGTAFVRHSDGLVEDVFGVGIEAVGAERGLGVSAFGADEVAPEMTAFSIDMDTAILTINFSEPIRASTASVPGNLFFASDTNAIPASTTHATSLANGLQLFVNVSYEDLTIIKLDPGLFTSRETSKLGVLPGFIQDMAGNAIATVSPSAPLTADSFAADVTAPELLGFDADMVEQTLHLSFNEPVLLSSVQVGTLRLTASQSAVPSATVTLGRSNATSNLTSSVATGPALDFVVQVDDGVANSLKANPALFSSAETSFIFAAAGLVRDAAANPLAAIAPNNAVQATNFTDDSTPPVLLRASLDMNQTQPLLLLSFSETMNISATQVWSVVLLSSSGASHQLQASVLNWMSSSRTEIAISISVADANAMKDKGVGLDANATFVSFPASAFQDMAGNDAVPQEAAQAFKVNQVIPDSQSPVLTSYIINMDTGLFKLFSLLSKLLLLDAWAGAWLGRQLCAQAYFFFFFAPFPWWMLFCIV